MNHEIKAYAKVHKQTRKQKIKSQILAQSPQAKGSNKKSNAFKVKITNNQKLFISPEDVYKIGDKPLKCHFEYDCTNDLRDRTHKNKSETKIKQQWEERLPQFWGCIVPSHIQTINKKKVSLEHKRRKYQSRSMSKTWKRNLDQIESRQNQSEMLLTKYIKRKNRSQTKQPIFSKINNGQFIENPEPKLMPKAKTNLDQGCNCQTLQFQSDKKQSALRQLQEKKKWQLEETQFIRKLKRFQLKYYNNSLSQKKTQATRKFQSTQISEPQQNTLFYTDPKDFGQQIRSHKTNELNKFNNINHERQDGAIVRPDQYFIQSNNIERYPYREDVSDYSKVKKLTELIKWRSRIITKIQQQMKSIKISNF